MLKSIFPDAILLEIFPKPGFRLAALRPDQADKVGFSLLEKRTNEERSEKPRCAGQKNRSRNGGGLHGCRTNVIRQMTVGRDLGKGIYRDGWAGGPGLSSLC